MVLSRIEIKSEIDAGNLRLDPMPPNERMGVSSIDLTLNTHVREFLDGIQPGMHIIDPSSAIDPSIEGVEMADVINSCTRERELESGDDYILHPHRLILGQTAEYIELPTHLAARVEGKSSLARLGISVHATAPTVQAGYKGTLTLEINSVGIFRVLLKPGMALAQLIIERVTNPPSEGYSGQYQGQGRS